MALPSHHVAGGGFRNPWPGGIAMGAMGVARWMLQRVLHPVSSGPNDARFPRAIPSHQARVMAPHVAITWVGHSSFLVQLDGVNVLTDPMWSDRASPVSLIGPKRIVPPGIPFDALPSIDAVLLSHNHYDHLDSRTVRRLVRRYPEAAWFTPLGVAAFVRARGGARVNELDWWQEASLGDMRVACAPAQHFSARGLRDRGRTLWCGWSIIGPTRRVFFAGDSAYHPEFARIGERHGPFDVTMIPIGAYEPRWFMRPVHMNAEEGVQAHLDLCAPHKSASRTTMVPMHWGTFRLTDEPLDEPPQRARRAWEAAALRPEAFWQLAHGETRKA